MNISELDEGFKEEFVNEALERGSYLRKIGVWPASDVFYADWLSNFETLDDRYVASKILNNFLYYSKPMVAKLLHDSVGSAISVIAQKTGLHSKDYYKKGVVYSYIPGERPNATDSGLLFMRKLKEELHIPESRTLMFDQLKTLIMDKGERTELQIVLCDDFVGSGCQCVKALTDVSLEKFKMSIYDFAQKFGHTIAFAPLIANGMGAKRVRTLLPNVVFTPAHVLGVEYNLFSPTCICWEGDADLYRAGVELIRRTSAKLEIVDNANGVVSVEGFGRQGLFIGFEHGIPDSDPAFFFYSDKGWKPLMRRPYERD
jgi:hypothetical protein